MYVMALTQFDDIRAGVRRNPGDEFIVSKARFKEINDVGMEKIGAPLVKETVREPMSPEGRKADRKSRSAKKA